MLLTETEEYHALRVVHEYLEPGERVLLFGRCFLKGNPVKHLVGFGLALLVPLLVCAFYLFRVTALVVAFAFVCAPVVMILGFRGREFGFCALTDRRLLQLGDEGVLEIASRNEVRQIAGTDKKVILQVAKVKADATVKERRLGVKQVRRIELSPIHNLVEVVGGKALLTDQLGSSQ
ncbi:MAG: hypothetical protein JST89_18665 [Cyanobacteria bacterium SZAS-4]|nr:hypothetical protein [Cyanobacteria bacterium SZAS-4]